MSALNSVYVILLCTNSSAAGQMSASLFGGNVTQWTTVAMDQTNLRIAVSTMLFH